MAASTATPARAIRWSGTCRRAQPPRASDSLRAAAWPFLGRGIKQPYETVRGPALRTDRHFGCQLQGPSNWSPRGSVVRALLRRLHWTSGGHLEYQVSRPAIRAGGSGVQLHAPPQRRQPAGLRLVGGRGGGDRCFVLRGGSADRRLLRSRHILSRYTAGAARRSS